MPNALPAPLAALGSGNTTTSTPDVLPIGAKIGIGLVVGLTVIGFFGIAIYYWHRRTSKGRKESINELHGQYVLEKVHELASPGEVIPELDDKTQIMAELPADMWQRNEDMAETSSLKELDTNERLDVVDSDARTRRRSNEIRMQRKHEQEMIRLETERENLQSPADKLANENREHSGRNDDGVYRPSDHAPIPSSPEDFGLSRITEIREIEPDTPVEENSLQRLLTPEPEGNVRPSIPPNEGTQLPISPVSSASCDPVLTI